jgi:pimeloyl-ACP methyl ester carboxylesterase
VAWFRPPTTPSLSNDDNRDHDQRRPLPLLFFHGIAPGGFALYLPLVLFGFATEKDRPVFIFENRSISCTIDFRPLTEDQTVDGVIECLERCGMQNSDVSLMGHSFGSCTIAWLVAAALSSSGPESSSPSTRKRPFRNSIRQIVLVDPVAILLSEPDVMVNFLYSNEIDKIRIAASSELFTEMYLRRHFAWYNSELHLDDVSKLQSTEAGGQHHDGDISDRQMMIVALSEKDEIINATKVKQEIERHGTDLTDLIYWTGVGHGAAVPSPTRWKEVKDRMLRQEETILSMSRSQEGERMEEDKKAR